MHGARLRGRLVLVRRGEADEHGKEQWLLLHKDDEHAVPGWDPEDHPRSVVTGRTDDEVRADADAGGGGARAGRGAPTVNVDGPDTA